MQLYTELAGSASLSQPDCADKARAFHGELAKLVARVDRLRPPRDVERLHEQFLDAARVSVAEIGRLADEVGRGKVRCGEEYNARAYGLPSTERAERVVQELGRRGYPLGLNAP